MKVMIVEYDPLISRIEEIRLTSKGHEICAVCRTGEDAVSTAGTTRPDVIVMDINLAGDMNGISAGKEIHASTPYPSYTLPVTPIQNHSMRQLQWETVNTL